MFLHAYLLFLDLIMSYCWWDWILVALPELLLISSLERCPFPWTDIKTRELTSKFLKLDCGSTDPLGKRGFGLHPCRTLLFVFVDGVHMSLNPSIYQWIGRAIGKL